jgi:hypothetical protein
MYATLGSCNLRVSLAYYVGQNKPQYIRKYKLPCGLNCMSTAYLDVPTVQL